MSVRIIAGDCRAVLASLPARRLKPKNLCGIPWRVAFAALQAWKDATAVPSGPFRMSKDIGVIVALPPAVRDWVEAQAEDLGVTAAIWIRMLVVAAARGRSALPAGPAIQSAPALPRAPAPAPADDASASGGLDPDAWRGPPDDDSDADIDAIVAGRMADAAAAVTSDAYAAPVILGPPNGGGARPLRRPPPAYSPARQPSHLRTLM